VALVIFLPAVVKRESARAKEEVEREEMERVEERGKTFA